MPLIQEIWVINKAGVILFNLQLGGTPIQRELLGGFISALEQFAGNLEEADVKSVILGSTRFSLAPLGKADLILAVRTESDLPEKKANKHLHDLREKLTNYLHKKSSATLNSQGIANVGFTLEFDDEINDIFFNMQ